MIIQIPSILLFCVNTFYIVTILLGSLPIIINSVSINDLDFEEDFKNQLREPIFRQINDRFHYNGYGGGGDKYDRLYWNRPFRKNRRAATARLERLWDYGVIPYEIESNFSGDHRALFKQAMKHWENYTCVKFVERTIEHPNYIIFTERPCGCCSYVGKRGNGPQAISIGKNCDKFGIVVHELGHVVGFWHEHTRPDRDENVQIVTENIMPGQEYNFNKLTEDEVNSLGIKYDFDSIMHYSRNTFSKSISLDTILPKDDPANTVRPEIGQRLRLSQGDIAQTKLLYRCPKCGHTIQNTNGMISSPNYPQSSPPAEGEYCEWRITGTHGERIIINITDIDIYETNNCENGYLEIRDGYWFKSPLIGKYCGQGEIQTAMMSKGHRLLISYMATPNQHNHRGFNMTYEVICGGDIVAEQGYLQSPNYPDEYRSNKECVWRITVPEGFQVALKFQSFEIENHDNCAYDYLEIRDGKSEDSTILGKFCGNKIPNEIRGSSNYLFVKFISDSSVNKAGFSATFIKEINECLGSNHGCEQECINTFGGYHCECRIGYELHSDRKKCENACGGIIESSNGTISSPSFPDLYPPNKNCIWEIVAEEGFRILLNFTFFDLEGNNQDCEYDKLDVKSKVNNHYSTHGLFCGSRLPPIITSQGHNIRLEFSSDNSVQRGGFNLHYFTDRDECAINNGGCQHICRNTIGSYVCECNSGYVLHENKHTCKEGSCSYQITSSNAEIISPQYPDGYPSKKDCTWFFLATLGHRVKLVFEDFDLEPQQECSYDYVIIYDGITTNKSVLGRFCGSKSPHPIISTTNKVLMKFKTDASVQKKGFKAHYYTVCGGRLFAKNSIEHLYSHFKFGDANYEKKEDCDWHIVTNIGMKIYLKFITFELEHEANCSYDFVEIFDGDDDNSPSLGKFCGNQMPTDMISSSESILIRFRTDDSIHNKGFTLIYSAVETIENELINAIDSNKSIEKSIRKTQQSFLNEKNNNYLSKYLSINEDQQDDFLLP
ncbi:Tolloid-like protein 1 [Sarcoptes scabiei]|uniref:Metalloendopeptidase n=1 Tax=Sarcoptes scabiei TaxID=52283 RepID=A0A834R2X9_SARSC|nr:Tolloid-like protein 1 [Sarcoptes scabiei]